jgi:hypothetical protein
MGGGGFLGLGPAPSAPAAPDYRGAAQETASGNLEAARVATAANRVNQVTPYGNLNYAETGTDSYGNPTWTATTSLSDVGQQLLNNQNATSLGLGGAINAQLGQVQNVMGQGFNPNTGPITTNIGQANVNPLTGQANLQTATDYQGGMQGWDRANQLLMQRLQPQMDIQQEQLDVKLANQGIAPGTEAYNRARMGLGMQQNDLLNQAQLSGLSAGNTLFQQGLAGAQFGNAAQQQGYQNTQAQQQANNAIAQQQFANQMANANLGNTAQQQQYNQALTQYNMPLNTLSALRTGAQVQNPSFVNSAQQATTQGADILGATQMGYNAQMGNFNAQQAAQQGMNSGLMSLGGTLGAAALMAPASDIRMKENIEHVGWLPNGLPVYTYEYKPEFRDDPFAGHGKHIGVMAQEVEQIMPEAVVTREDGYKMVNYGALNA